MKDKDTYQIADEPDPEKSREVQVEASQPGPERMLISTEMKAKMAKALGLLTPVERVAFTMRHMEGRSVDEISQALKVKNSAAKNTIFRAVKKLRQQLEPFASVAR